MTKIDTSTEAEGRGMTHDHRDTARAMAEDHAALERHRWRRG